MSRRTCTLARRLELLTGSTRGIVHTADGDVFVIALRPDQVTVHAYANSRKLIGAELGTIEDARELASHAALDKAVRSLLTAARTHPEQPAY